MLRGLGPLPFLTAAFALTAFFAVLMIHDAHGGVWWATAVPPVAFFGLILLSLARTD